ncbi:MAG TPA: PIG-L deacetylase family protein [Armatimonadota bacterium]|jgi:LmbE family N-acetylglucosaminyl deacetylase
MRVMAVGAHPDDIEILCAGTLARYVARGDEVVNVVFTNGDMGHTVIPPEELAEIRCEEARRAAETVGAQFKMLGEPDEWLFHDRRTRTLMIDAIREYDPDVIITHSPDDYHPDHRCCSDIVFAASFLCTVPHIESAHTGTKSIATLIYMDTLGGTNFLPDEYVDITDTIDLKLAALNNHQSQLKWMREHDNIDLGEFVRTSAATRGLQASVPFAEGFQIAPLWPRLKTVRVLP